LPYDPAYPVVCYDERPCFLIGDLIDPVVMQTGQIRKEHYAYEKNGSCALLAAIEPLTGYRLAQVHTQKMRGIPPSWSKEQPRMRKPHFPVIQKTPTAAKST